MIRTERLLLRPLCAADLEPLHSMFSNPKAMRYWDRPAWQDMDHSRRLLEAFMKDAPEEHLELAVVLDGVTIGRVGMWKLWEVGYIFDPDHWGKGYASEAMHALIAEIASQFPNAPELTAEIDPRNIGSRRVLEKIGFQQTGYEEKNFLYGADEWCDTAYFMLPRDTLDALRG